jgi:hypothetical protein
MAERPARSPRAALRGEGVPVPSGCGFLPLLKSSETARMLPLLHPMEERAGERRFIESRDLSGCPVPLVST